jgi:hypothetical protein
MNANVVAGSLLSGLVMLVAPLAGQQVSADVLVRSGPVAGHVVVDDGYSTYHRPSVRRVVVERHAPRVIVVERVHRWRPERHWRRLGYRPVTLFYLDGRYYDRPIRHRRGAHEVVVYERGGRFYADCDDRDRHRGHQHDDDDRYGGDRHRHGNWDD